MDLYIYVPPLGENIPVSVEPFLVDDLVPTEEEIKWAVTQLQNHSSRGASEDAARSHGRVVRGDKEEGEG